MVRTSLHRSRRAGVDVTKVPRLQRRGPPGAAPRPESLLEPTFSDSRRQSQRRLCIRDIGPRMLRFCREQAPIRTVGRILAVHRAPQRLHGHEERAPPLRFGDPLEQPQRVPARIAVPLELDHIADAAETSVQRSPQLPAGRRRADRIVTISCRG